MSKNLHDVFLMGIPKLFKNGEWEENSLFKNIAMAIIDDGEGNVVGNIEPTLWSYVANIPLQKIIDGDLTDEEHCRLNEATWICLNSKIKIVRASWIMSSKDLKEIVAHFKWTKDIECFFIDSKTPNYELLEIDQILLEYDVLLGTYKI